MSHHTNHQPWHLRKPYVNFLSIDTIVPDLPFDFLPALAERARSFLKKEDYAHISKHAEHIEILIEAHYEFIRAEIAIEIQRTQFLELDKPPGREASIEVELKAQAEACRKIEEALLNKTTSNPGFSIPIFPTRANISDVTTMKTLCDTISFSLNNPNGWPLHQYFSTLALFCIQDCINLLESMQLKDSISQKNCRHDDHIFASEIIFCATEAVCHAEHLLKIKELGFTDPKPMETVGAIAKAAVISSASNQARSAAQKKHEKEAEVKAQLLKYAATRPGVSATTIAKNFFHQCDLLTEKTLASYIRHERRQNQRVSPKK